jgi:N5-(cytidine 5'-diphosphoramidyl)-L-glutamine hydrolase
VKPASRQSDIDDAARLNFSEAPFAQAEHRREARLGDASAPLKLIAVSQSVEIIHRADGSQERRDVLDQSWIRLLHTCGYLALPVPNQPRLAARFFDDIRIDGVLLTCGNELAVNGGDAPERDRTEFMLVTHAAHHGLPVLGVGRGMQIIQHLFSVPLNRVRGHAASTMKIKINGKDKIINSDHHYGAEASVPGLNVWASSRDGVVKAVRSRNYNLTGIMWRPDQTNPFADSDIEILARAFDVNWPLI